MDVMMVKQFQRKKRILYKELAAKLIQSNLNITHYEKLYVGIVNFLKKDEKQMNLPAEMQGSFVKAVNLLGR